MPQAMYLSVITVIFIYLVVSVAVIGNLPIPAIVAAKDYALAQAAKPFLGVGGFHLTYLLFDSYNRNWRLNISRFLRKIINPGFSECP